MFRRAALFLALLAASPAFAADAVLGLMLPIGNDTYAQLAARAATGDKSVDFRSLRLAYLSSAARAGEDGAEISQLKDAMVKAIDARDNTTVRALATQILSKRYVDIDVHAVMTTACDLMKDTACAAQSQFMVEGLMKSILSSGDGTSCATGWEVVTAREEYVVMAMQDADIKQSNFVQEGGHTCQALIADDGKGGALTYYFNIDLIRADISAQMSAASPEVKSDAAPAPPAAAPPSRPAGQ